MAEISVGFETAQRIPVVPTDREGFHPESANAQWMRVTEAIRQDVIAGGVVRGVVAGFVTAPLSEALPRLVIDQVAAVDSRIARIAARYSNRLGVILNLPEVPDEQIVPDISNAKSLKTVEGMRRNLQSLGYQEDDPRFEEHLEDYIRFAEESGQFSYGITQQERILIAQRYRFARDMKIMALGAEILAQPAHSVRFDEAGRVRLPSGVQIAVDTSQADQRADMLNPVLWESRIQLKDRVYVIEIAGRKYILKEKKTARHTDTKKGGHQESISSEEEFETARFFQQHGNMDEGDVALRWEKPIGFVTYPDGFQFTVFEYEEGIKAGYSSEIAQDLTRRIMAHPNEYQQEYAQIRAEATKHKGDIKLDPYEQYRYEEIEKEERRRASSISSRLARLVRRRASVPRTREEIENEFTFEQFAMLKALSMTTHADEIYNRAVYGNNYINSDGDGTAFRIHDQNGLRLEIIGFDFEYFSKASPQEAAGCLNRFLQQHKSLQNLPGRLTRIEKAAYMVMSATKAGAPKTK